MTYLQAYGYVTLFLIAYLKETLQIYELSQRGGVCEFYRFLFLSSPIEAE